MKSVKGMIGVNTWIDFEAIGAKNEEERTWAYKTAMKILQMTRDIMNIEHMTLSKDKYGEVFIGIADVCSEHIGVKKGRIVRLPNSDCITIDPILGTGTFKCVIQDYDLYVSEKLT